MPLPRSAARRASRKNEVLPLLGWNGGTEDAASGDDWSPKSVTCIGQQAPRHRTMSPNFGHRDMVIPVELGSR